MVLLMDVMTTAAMLFIVTAGLMMVFGVMKIINFAHGALPHARRLCALVVTQLGSSRGVAGRWR